MQDSNCMKYSFLLLGGNGFIGRNFVEYLINNNLSTRIRIVDKVPHQLSWFNEKHKKLYFNESIEYRSANLMNKSSCQNAFEDQIGFDFVVNFAAETRLGQSDPVYNEGIYKLSINCANEAAKHKVKKYVEISSGQLETTDKQGLKESDNKVKPWTILAKYKLNIENELSKIENLNYCIIRPALVYGMGDRAGVMPRILMGAVYKHLGEKMKLLWDEDLKINTVHVEDVCGAIWFVCCNHVGNREIFNIVDKSNTTQGSLSKLISDIFGISHDFWGNTMSKISIKSNGLEALIEEINDKHMSPWFDLCAKYGVNNTPLNPFLYPEMLQNNDLFLNGNKLEGLGFEYRRPRISKEALTEIIYDYIEMALFPKITLS